MPNRYPQGKVVEHDEGETSIRVGTDQVRQVVVVHFHKPIYWFAMPRAEALALAELIKKHAELLPDVPTVNSPPAEGTQ